MNSPPRLGLLSEYAISRHSIQEISGQEISGAQVKRINKPIGSRVFFQVNRAISLRLTNINSDKDRWQKQPGQMLERSRGTHHQHANISSKKPRRKKISARGIDSSGQFKPRRLPKTPWDQHHR
jgi:hypothetical protein